MELSILNNAACVMSACQAVLQWLLEATQVLVLVMGLLMRHVPLWQGMWAHKLSCEAYQDLLDRGWRRSGLWLYRPLPDKQAACKCHPYTIRLDTAAFQPSKVWPGECRLCLVLCCLLCANNLVAFISLMTLMHGPQMS